MNQITSTCSAESEDSQLLLIGLDIPQKFSAKKTPSVAESSTSIGRTRQALKTSEISTEQNGKGVGCLQEDFLANLSVYCERGSDEARKITATSGTKCFVLLRKQGPVSSLLKMLLESSRWRSPRFYLTWKAKATKQGRLFFQLVPSMPHTDETDAGYWPTPTSSMHKGSGSTIIRKDGKDRRKDRIDYAVETTSGTLNPNWIEWTMGYPKGWTDLKH